jgi:chemotaxis protein histidine kinase CheA
MFVDEVAERSARLVEGARSLREGTITPHEAGELLREGHTIKGTGRVMGYDDVGTAGLMLEMIWRWIQHGDITPAPIFGRVLEALSATIPRALDDPRALVDAMTAVHEFFGDQHLPEDLPAVPEGTPRPAAQAAGVAPPPVDHPAEQAVAHFERSAPPMPTPSIAEAAQRGVRDLGPAEEPAGDQHATPVSAQEAFAALRAQMARGEARDTRDETEDTSDETHDAGAEGQPQESAHDGDFVPDVEGRARDTDDEGTRVDFGADASDDVGGSVIAFPLNGTSLAVDDDRGASRDDVGRLDERETSSSIVVLPSNGRRQSPVTDGPTDLGGLVGAVRSWAEEESVAVAAGRLYGLVDHIVSLRMNLDALQGHLTELAEIAAADPFFSERVSGLLDEMTPIGTASDRIEARALGLAAVPLSTVTGTLPQLCRYLGRKTGKELRIEIIGDDVLVDRQVLDRLGDAIRQLVVNAAVHGIEDVDRRIGVGKPGTGTIRVIAEQTDVNLAVAVTDDGRGIDWSAVREKGLATGLLSGDAEMSPEALRSLLYRPGFSTLDAADELAGDGGGLAALLAVAEALNGSLGVESAPGASTKVTVTVPVHHAMQKALLVVAGGLTWGIPETAVDEVVEMHEAKIVVGEREPTLERADGGVPFAGFSDVMGLASVSVPTAVVVAKGAGGRVALGVERVIGVRRVAARELGTVLSGADAVTGAALLGGDDVVLLVDTTRLAERQRHTATERPGAFSARVLVVDDSKGVQQVVSSALATSGYQTSVASNVAEALGTLQMKEFDAIVVDFSMPRADGVALAHMVRQRHGDLPIVMLSGVADGEDVERARDAGVDAFFDKGDLREGGLTEALRGLITAHRARQQTA